MRRAHIVRTAPSARLARAGLAILAALAPACAHKDKAGDGVKILVPDTATVSPDYDPTGAIPSRRYVIRMSDGQRDWEVELPEGAGGYEVRIPLNGEHAPGVAGLPWETTQLTQADKELIKELRRGKEGMEREGVYVGDENALDLQAAAAGAIGEPKKAKPGEAGPAPTRPSYFLGIEEVNRLFKSGNLELAMVRLVDLERAYPDDVKLLSMKGTLWLKLGMVALAREAWEKVLQIDPRNKPVIEALRRLNADSAQ
jgi:tetratricopeptide (TPR) repeat protein